MLDERLVDPAMTRLTIRSDGTVLAESERDPGVPYEAGTADELEWSLAGLLNAACLTNEERAEWQRLYWLRVSDWRCMA